MLEIDLSGRNALVVGGSRGIGASITLHLAGAGAYVVFTHTGNPEHSARIAELVSEAERGGGTARPAAVDARNGPAMRALAEGIVRERGALDVLVCNAGMNVARPLDGQSDAEWEESIALNLGTAYYGVRAAIPSMIEKCYGRIILVGSSAVVDGGGGAIDYAAAKAGMVGMMTFLCRNYARKGILTNIVHPCVIETDLLKKRYADAEARRKLVAQVPVGRLGRPEDIAGLVAFLASPWGDFICGQQILADGGRTIFGK